MNGFYNDNLKKIMYIMKRLQSIAGISFPFSMAGRQESDASRKSLYVCIFRRGLVLELFGMIYNGLLDFGFVQTGSASVTGGGFHHNLLRTKNN
jgi:hypothetical protein